MICVSVTDALECSPFSHFELFQHQTTKNKSGQTHMLRKKNATFFKIFLKKFRAFLIN